ncbi:uncharacterized protein LOC142625074 [Castanea sativa]|uniref:uncharacterized protein LOC142625074 n=1 Tax=Castanea sativa TaxID=21020 RepID=UPI003F64CB23
MDLMMDALKGRVSSDLDELVHRMDSPFIAPVTSFPLPSKFHLPQIEAYDGSKDLLDHLETFKILRHLQGVADKIMCRAFPTTLRGPARVWFSRLTPYSISTFKELSTQFASHFIGGHMYKKLTACLMNIKQREDETLRFYITRFNKEALSIDKADDKILVAMFTNGLRRQGKLQRFVSRKKTDQPQEQGSRRESECPKPPIGDIRMIVGGTTTSCSTKKAHKTYLQVVQNVQPTGMVPKMAHIDNPMIGFSEEDAQCLHHLHDDALVVSIQIRDYNTHKVLVDNDNSVDILYYPALQQMRIGRERLIPTGAPLVGFRGTRAYPIGAITLLVTVGDYTQQITKDVTFLVVDYSSAYNAILGHPTLNSWKAVTSTYHLMIKFPTKYGVGEVRGDQVAACEC